MTERVPRGGLGVLLACVLTVGAGRATALDVLDLAVIDEPTDRFPGSGDGDGWAEPDESVGLKLRVRVQSALPPDAQLQLAGGDILLTLTGEFGGSVRIDDQTVSISPTTIRTSMQYLGDLTYEADYAQVFRPLVAAVEAGEYVLGLSVVRRKPSGLYEVLDEGEVSLPVEGRDTSGTPGGSVEQPPGWDGQHRDHDGDAGHGTCWAGSPFRSHAAGCDRRAVG